MSSAKVNTFDWFKTTYKWMVKTYPDTVNLFDVDTFETEFIGGVLTQKFIKGDNGRWTLDKATVDSFTAYNYCNTIDAIPFFRGLGGRERTMSKQTRYGYIPMEVSSESPDGQSRTVRTFKFYQHSSRRV